MPVIIKDLSKIYGNDDEIRVTALDNINLTINDGDFMAIIGPSGSGKTTFLNLIGGLIGPSKGSITNNSISIDKLSDEERTQFRLAHMGFIFQDYQLLPVLTAKENVELPLYLNKPTDDAQEKVQWALEQVGLGKLGHRRPNQLSGGQQQRVSIARAIVNRPSLILADEPTANLDSKTAQEIIDLFKKLNSEFKLTFIFSTHDERLIKQVKKVIHIRDGKFEEVQAHV